MRAEAFARLGLVQVCRQDQLTPERLREQIVAALKTRPEDLKARANAALNFDGAEKAAEWLLSLASDKSKQAARVTPTKRVSDSKLL